jgi:Single-stranded DNA-binding protein
MIIISGRLAREGEIREGVSPKGKPYSVMNNCVFVTNKELGRDVPMNITAWGENARFIQENFKKGDSIQLVAQETPHDRKVDDKEFTECIFTVKKILDWSMYINTVRFLGNTLSRIENSFTERTHEAQNEFHERERDGRIEDSVSVADDSQVDQGYVFEEDTENETFEQGA